MNRTEALRILGLDEDATLADIKTAYKETAQILHPDRFATNKKLQDRATEQFKNLQEAYEYLTSGKGSRTKAGRTASATRAYGPGGQAEARLAGIAAARTQLVHQRDVVYDERRNGLVMAGIGAVVAILFRKPGPLLILATAGVTAVVWGIIQAVGAQRTIGTLNEHIDELKASLPEMPSHRRARLQKEWGFTDIQMRDVNNAGAVDLIDETVKEGASAAGALKWWLGELSREANEKSVSLEELPVTPTDVASLEKLIADGKLNDRLAKQTMAGVLKGEGTPEEVVAKHGYKIVGGGDELDGIVDKALADNPDVAEKLKNGDMKPMGVIIGAVMRATRGQADAKAVSSLVIKKVRS